MDEERQHSLPEYSNRDGEDWACPYVGLRSLWLSTLHASILVHNVCVQVQCSDSTLIMEKNVSPPLPPVRSFSQQATLPGPGH